MKLTKPGSTAVATVRDEFDRLFDQLHTSGLFGVMPRAFDTVWSPSMDFSENEKEYIARLEAPGMAKEDLDVNVDGPTLTITGHRDVEKHDQSEEYFWREREAGKFVRALQLPTAIDRAKVTAIYENGIMTVRLPKAENAAKTRIPVK